VIRVGSSMNKVYPYYSDIDIMNIIIPKKNVEETIQYFITQVKIMIKQIQNNKNIFFSDFKVGGFHWSVQQIFDEKYEQLKLSEACKVKDVIKIDIIVPYDGRYMEMSTFFILKSLNEYINVENNYFDLFPERLLKDIGKYKDNYPFKAVKRVWSLARIKKDIKVAKQLENLIRSNVTLLARINSDIDTIVLIVEKNLPYNLEMILKEIDSFKESISTILDINIDFEKIDLMIDNIVLLLKCKLLNEPELNIIGALHRLRDYILIIINRETKEYIKNINFAFPITNSGIVVENDNLNMEILDTV